MATKGIKVEASRFALLHIDDDDESEEETPAVSKNKQAPSKNQHQQSSSAKKKNKKKKKADSTETAELRSLAFGSGKSAGKVRTNSTGNRSGSGDHHPDASSKQWEEWEKKDAQFADTAYETDLQQALLLSKLEYEEKKDHVVVLDDGSNKKKKKNKEKPGTMSLEQFNQLSMDTPPAEEEVAPEFMPVKAKPNTNVENPDPEFFDNVNNDVSRIIQKEKIQEEYTKQYKIGSAQAQHYQAQIEKKDAEIEKLKAENVKLAEDLKQVKKRNSKLCQILSQGEMKEKATVLVELEQLKQVRDELTGEVANLTSELEKERSTVHALKAGDSNKSKGSKHGGR